MRTKSSRKVTELPTRDGKNRKKERQNEGKKDRMKERKSEDNAAHGKKMRNQSAMRTERPSATFCGTGEPSPGTRGGGARRAGIAAHASLHAGGAGGGAHGEKGG